MSSADDRQATVVVSDATEADMGAVQDIYAHHVLHGLATFEETPPSVSEMAERRRAVLAQTYGYAKDRYDAGYASYLEHIDAQRNLFQAEIEVINLRQSQLDNLIALYRALGGGWSAAQVLPAEPGTH